MTTLIRSKKIISKALSSDWGFPGIVLLVVLLLSSLHIHGSSLGVYNRIFYGANYEDPNLLFGITREIRSDEWLGWTQLSFAQANNDFPEINENIRSGLDISVIVDAPHRGWTTIFEPQNIIYFVSPSLSFAFAFKWWFMLAMLLVSSYFFALKAIKLSKSKSILLALFISLTPMGHWWYQIGFFGSMTYVFIGLTLLHLFIETNRKPTKVIALAALFYVAAAFALIQYPPFQIGAAIPGLFYVIGYFLNVNQGMRRDKLKGIVARFLPLLIPVFTAAFLIFVFLAEREKTIELISNSLHPGVRQFSSGMGGIDWFAHFFSSNIAPVFQFFRYSNNYFTNQSEASNFVLLAPFLVIPSLIIFYAQTKAKGQKKDWRIITLIICFLLALAWLFLPNITAPMKVFLLNRVPIERLPIILGTTSILLLSVLLKSIEKNTLSKATSRMVVYSGLLSVITITFVANYFTLLRSPDSVPGIWFILATIGLYALITVLLLRSKIKIALSLLIIFSLGSVYRINPLYKGIAPLQESDLAHAIRQETTDPQAYWTTIDVLQFENYPRQLGYKSISGGQHHPQPEFWANFPSSQDYYPIYNRSAHVIVRLVDESSEQRMELEQPNAYAVYLDPCGSFAKSINLRHLLTLSPVNDTCITLSSTVKLPARNIYLYDVSSDDE